MATTKGFQYEVLYGPASGAPVGRVRFTITPDDATSEVRPTTLDMYRSDFLDLARAFQKVVAVIQEDIMYQYAEPG